jgi:hypothetical protein
VPIRNLVVPARIVADIGHLGINLPSIQSWTT